jgi:hypothetical protein
VDPVYTEVSVPHARLASTARHEPARRDVEVDGDDASRARMHAADRIQLRRGARHARGACDARGRARAEAATPDEQAHVVLEAVEALRLCDADDRTRASRACAPSGAG